MFETGTLSLRGFGGLLQGGFRHFLTTYRTPVSDIDYLSGDFG